MYTKTASGSAGAAPCTSATYKRKTPFLAKLGIVTFVSLSIGGTVGFLFNTLTKQTAQFLSLAITSAASAALLAGWTVRRNGVVNLLPSDLDNPLYEWDLIQTVRYIQSTFDYEAAQVMMKELAPLALVKTQEETELVIRNMSGRWQRILTTKGLLGLLPPEFQRMLLPKGAPLVEAPPNIEPTQPADISSQVALFRELALRRLIELRDDLATRSKVAWVLKVAGDMAGKLYGLVKENTSSDLQVTVIMSVIGLLVLRVAIVVSLFSIRKALSIFYFW